MLKTRIIPSNPIMVLEGEKKNLIITDIHIGFESIFASNEIFIGKNSSINETITNLSNVIDSEKPDSLILLGDIKSSIKNISKMEWEDVPLFFKKIREKVNNDDEFFGELDNLISQVPFNAFHYNLLSF